nr:MAG TPA: hypothetical protein [Caudoviricetes sp.]
MRIAGVYASAFLLSLPNILFFLLFLTLCYVYENKKQYNLPPPARVSNLTTPGILNDITDRLPT